MDGTLTCLWTMGHGCPPLTGTRLREKKAGGPLATPLFPVPLRSLVLPIALSHPSACPYSVGYPKAANPETASFHVRSYARVREGTEDE